MTVRVVATNGQDRVSGRWRAGVGRIGCVLALTAALASCGGGGKGGGDGGTGASGISASKMLPALTPSEQATVCDWSVEISGGYGKETMCGDGTTASNPENQAECLMEVPWMCQVTVSAFESCTKVLAADPCDFNAALDMPGCQAFLPCLLAARK